MQRIYLLAGICLIMSRSLYGQIKYDEELLKVLQGITNVHEIEKIAGVYFDETLRKTNSVDTVRYKNLMRQKKFLSRKIWMSRLYTNVKGEEVNVHKVNSEAIEEIKRMKPAAGQRNQPSEWIQKGPYTSNNGIGRMDKIAFHPTNPNTIYAGSAYGGLFKTTDYGESWNPVSEFLPSLGISGIAIHPTDPEMIYVLTGDPNTGGSCFNGNVCFNFGEYISASAGIFMTRDSGITWSNLFDFSAFPYRGLGLLMNPVQPNILFAATTAGLFRSMNSGQTWTMISSNIVLDMEFNPIDPTIIYTVTSNNFFVSSDNGNTFSNIINIPFSDRISIAVTPAIPSRVYILASDNNNTISFISNDQGASFITTSTQHVIGGQSSFNHAIAANPNNGNDVFAGGLSAWRSTNSTSNWTQVSGFNPTDPAYLHPDIHDMQYSPFTNELWCANDGGIYVYTNNNWIPKYNGLTTTQFYKFARRDRNQKIAGGTQDNGIQEQVAMNNYNMFSTGDGYDVMTDHPYLVNNGSSENTYYTINQFILKNCIGFGCFINVPGNTDFLGRLAMSPVDKDKIYVGYSNGLWRSVNGGGSWVNISPNPANWCVSGSVNDNIMYYAGTNGLFKYVEGSGTVGITPGAPYNVNLQITDIDVSRANADHIYISVGGVAEKAKVFYSQDGGMNWENLTLNLPNLPVLCVKVDGTGGIYIGTNVGVFYKPVNYNYWQPYSNGLPNVPVSQIELDPVPFPTNGKLPPDPPSTPEVWISTYGRGLWVTQQYTPNCPFDLVLTDISRGNRLEEAVNNITSNQRLNSTGNTIRYSASNRITLTDGFSVTNNTRFKTYLNGCGSQVID